MIIHISKTDLLSVVLSYHGYHLLIIRRTTLNGKTCLHFCALTLNSIISNQIIMYHKIMHNRSCQQRAFITYVKNMRIKKSHSFCSCTHSFTSCACSMMLFFCSFENNRLTLEILHHNRNVHVNTLIFVANTFIKKYIKKRRKKQQLSTTINEP